MSAEQWSARDEHAEDMSIPDPEDASRILSIMRAALLSACPTRRRGARAPSSAVFCRALVRKYFCQ